MPFTKVLYQAFFLLTVNGRFLFDASKRKWGFDLAGVPAKKYCLTKRKLRITYV